MVKKTIVILGGTGYIGSEFIRKYHDKYRLRVLVHSTAPQNLVSLQDVEFFQGDITKKETLEELIQNSDIIVNLIGQVIPNKELLKKISILGTQNTIELAKKYHIKKIVHISSTLVYGETVRDASKEIDKKLPSSEYAKIKLNVEDIYLTSHLPLIVLRLSNVYGNNQPKGFLRYVLDAQKTGEILSLPSTPKIRNFIHVEDVVRAINLAIGKQIKESEIYNITNDKKIYIKDIVTMVESLGEKQINKKLEIRNDEDFVFVDSSQAKEKLGFQANIELKEGVRRYFNEK